MSMDADDVVARESIRDLVARYNSYSDSGRFEPLWELFAPEAVMELRHRGSDEVRRHEGREQVKEIFAGAAATVAGGEPAERPRIGFVRHFTATHQIDLVDATTARGRLYFAVLTDIGLDHWGRYVDRYARLGDRWCFTERIVTVDAYAPGTLFA
jgi:hypothetical protein